MYLNYSWWAPSVAGQAQIVLYPTRLWLNAGDYRLCKQSADPLLLQNTIKKARYRI